MANSTHEPVRTMLAGTLDEQLLGTEINLSVYATNIYRLLGCQAGTDLESFNGRFDNFITRLKSKKPQRAMKAALKTGHEHLVDYDTTLQQLRNGMPSPNSRLIDELFWPHVNGPVIEALQTDAWLGQLTELVAPLAQDNRDDHEGAKARHAAAVLSHIAAITNQTQALKGESTFDPDLWACAREYWNRTLNDDVFWDYLSHRAKDLGASLLKAHDLQALRDRMPSVIQAFHLTIARSCFEKLDKPNVGSQHLEIFTDGQMPMTVTCGLRNLTQAWIGHQLKKPTDALKAKFDHVSGKIDYADAKTVVMEVIRRTREAWEQLSEQKQMAQLIIDAGAFDGIAQQMIDNVNKLSIQSDDADRALLLRALTFKALAQLPVSAAIKRKLDQNRRDAIRIMYSQVLDEDEDAQQFDPTVCFFADGAEPDPDASLVLSFHKIRTLTCVNYTWKKASLLIPRSKMAQRRHQGSVGLGLATLFARMVATPLRLTIGRGGMAQEKMNQGFKNRAVAAIINKANTFVSAIETRAAYNVNVRSESTQTSHPIIKRAEKGSFKLGKEPDTDEAQRKMSAKFDDLYDSLDYAERRFLEQIQEANSEEDFRKVLKKIEALPKSRRTIAAMKRILEGGDPANEIRQPVSANRNNARSSPSESSGNGCPKCGFGYAWNGTSCAHCGFRP